jgi:Ankyrin repeats (3 copies)
MQIAARNGSIPTLELLSLNGGSIATKGIIGDSLFQLAASNGHLEVVKWLNRNGLVEVPDTTGNTAVHVAARRVEVDILRYLDIDVGCCFCQANDEGQTPEDCIPRRGAEMAKLGKCRELVKNIVAEAGRQVSEEELGALNRRASGHHLSSSQDLDYFKAAINQR